MPLPSDPHVHLSTRPKQRRLPRFCRVPDRTVAFEFTVRDLEILRQVMTHRFLRSSRIAALVGGSSQQLRRRLQLLYHHGYLDRPRSQIEYFYEHGSKEIAYGLAKRGAGRLRRDLDIPFSRMVWQRSADEPRQRYLLHSLMIADVLIAIELACRKREGVQFLSSSDLDFANKANRASPHLHWSVTLPSRERVGVVPDAVFGLRVEGLNGQSVLHYFFLEADRGTMPIQRDSPTQSSFRRKLLAYEATWIQGLHKSKLGLNRFRVLTITTSRARCKNLVTTASRLGRGKGLFLFGDLDTFSNSPDVLAHPLESAMSDPTRCDSLLPPELDRSRGL